MVWGIAKSSNINNFTNRTTSDAELNMGMFYRAQNGSSHSRRIAIFPSFIDILSRVISMKLSVSLAHTHTNTQIERENNVECNYEGIILRGKVWSFRFEIHTAIQFRFTIIFIHELCIVHYAFVCKIWKGLTLKGSVKIPTWRLVFWRYLRSMQEKGVIGSLDHLIWNSDAYNLSLYWRQFCIFHFFVAKPSSIECYILKCIKNWFSMCEAMSIDWIACKDISQTKNNPIDNLFGIFLGTTFRKKVANPTESIPINWNVTSATVVYKPCLSGIWWKHSKAAIVIIKNWFWPSWM